MIEPYARTAFAGGYAEAGEDAFPIPAHVHRDLRAAVEAAGEVTHPAVLESVRRAGRSSGLYVVMQRRLDALEARWNGKLRPVLRQVGHSIGARVAHAVLSRREALATPPPEQDVVQQAIQELTDLGIWNEWLNIIRQAMTEGAAEGRAAGTVWLASAQGGVLPSFEVEFPQQLQALENLGALPGWNDVNSWQAKQVEGIAYQMGRELADAQASGAGFDDLLSIVESAITGDDSYAYLLLDNAIGASTIQGRLGVYGDEGVLYVDLMISPDACDVCIALATGNPYSIGSAPEVPVHPRCRCDLVPEV